MRALAVALALLALIAWRLLRWATSDAESTQTPRTELLMPTCEEMRRTYSVRNSSTTVVTAFFDVVAEEHLEGKAEEWAASLLSLDSHMIIFTDSIRIINMRRRLAPQAPTHVVQITLEKFEPYKTYFRQLVQLADPKADISAFYLTKVEMLWWATVVNPWNTQKFLWIDVDSIRTEDYKRALMGSVFPFPAKEKLVGPWSAITVFSLAGDVPEPPCAKINWVYSNSLKPVILRNKPSAQALQDFLHPTAAHAHANTFLAPGSFGGSKRAIERLRTIFNAATQDYLNRSSSNKPLNLADGALLVKLACEQPDLIQVIKPVYQNTPDPLCAEAYRPFTRHDAPWSFYLRYFS